MQATGIQIDGTVVRRATIRRTRHRLSVIQIDTHKIVEANVKPLYFTAGCGLLVSGLHSSDLIIRSRTFSPSKSLKLRQALILQVEAQLHLKAEELITVSIFESQEKRATTYSTTQAALSAHLQELNNLHIDPERVGAVPAALKAFVQWKAPECTSFFLLNIGLTHTNCLWVENNLIQKAHAIPLGLEQLDAAFVRDQKEEARSFRRELAKILHSFQCQRPLIFTGTMDPPGFHDFLLEGLCECTSEEKNITCSPDERRYAICIGLALDYLLNTKQPIQFRAIPAVSPQTWNRLGRRGVSLLGAAAAFCLIVYALGGSWIRGREQAIAHNLETWTLTQDPKIRVELFSAGTKPQTLVTQWLKFIKQNAKDYRLIMKAPKVTRFLDWLSHHPLIESFRAASDPVSFEEIHYQLVSLPRLEAMDDPYLVKIDLDFKVSNALSARKFNEMLLQDADLVDATQEITWEVLSDRYQTSFYLKNE